MKEDSSTHRQLTGAPQFRIGRGDRHWDSGRKEVIVLRHLTIVWCFYIKHRARGTNTLTRTEVKHARTRDWRREWGIQRGISLYNVAFRLSCFFVYYNSYVIYPDTHSTKLVLPQNPLSWIAMTLVKTQHQWTTLIAVTTLGMRLRISRQITQETSEDSKWKEWMQSMNVRRTRIGQENCDGKECS